MMDPLCTASSRLPLEEDWLLVDPGKIAEVAVVPPVVVAPVVVPPVLPPVVVPPVFVPPLPRMLVLLDPVVKPPLRALLVNGLGPPVRSRLGGVWCSRRA